MVRTTPQYNKYTIDYDLLTLGNTSNTGNVINYGNVGIGTQSLSTTPTSTLYIYNPATNTESVYIKSTHEDPDYMIGDGSFVIDKGGAVGIGTTMTETYGLNIYKGSLLVQNGQAGLLSHPDDIPINQAFTMNSEKASQFQDFYIFNTGSTPTRTYHLRLDTDGYAKHNLNRTPATGYLFSINNANKLKVEDTTTTITNNLDLGILTISNPSATESRFTIDDSVPNNNIFTIYTNGIEQLRIDEFKTSPRQLNGKEVFTYYDQQFISNGNSLYIGVDTILNTSRNYPTGLYAYNVNATLAGVLTTTGYASGFFHYIKGSGAIAITNTFAVGLTISRIPAFGDIQITNSSGLNLVLTASFAPVATAYAV